MHLLFETLHYLIRCQSHTLKDILDVREHLVYVCISLQDSLSQVSRDSHKLGLLGHLSHATA
jgi:hypothetical protein